MEKSIETANKMIQVYNNTPIEKYPEARAIDVLDNLPFGSRERTQAFNLFQSWLDYKDQADEAPTDPQSQYVCEGCE